MERLSSSFVLGYHGCYRDTATKILESNRFVVSNNGYDWLGKGIYFWESNPHRAYFFMKEKYARDSKDLKYPDKDHVSQDFCVLGAVIDMGICLDLCSSATPPLLTAGYKRLMSRCKKEGQLLPKNTYGKDKILRELDCAVVNTTIGTLRREPEPPVLIQTVRGVFIEGRAAYKGGKIYTKTHIQISVIDETCIKGIFRVPHSEYMF